MYRDTYSLKTTIWHFIEKKDKKATKTTIVQKIVHQIEMKSLEKWIRHLPFMTIKLIWPFLKMCCLGDSNHSYFLLIN